MYMFFIVIFGLYLSGNVYIFIRGLQTVSGLSLPIKVGLGIIYWVLALLFFISFRNRDWNMPESVSQVMHSLGSSWLLFTLYMVLLLLVVDLLKLFHLQWDYSFYAVAAFTICLLIYGSYNYHHPDVKVVDIPINKSLLDGQKQLKIVGISDVHLGHGTGKAKLKGYVDLINAQNPDVVLISGDLIDNDLTPLYKEHMEEELSQLKAPMGVYMVPGNHESFGGGVEAAAKFIALTPIMFLTDSLVTLPNGLQILGRYDRSTRERKTLAELVQCIDNERPVILLDHQPYELAETEKAKIDLQFSGHTHRGQIWPISLLTDAIFELSYGHERFGDTHVYVSSGLSLWGPPFRIGTNSELVVFNITLK